MCSNVDKDNCRARLIVDCNRTVVKGIHSCMQAKRICQIRNNEVSVDIFIQNFIEEKSRQLELYPDRIYKELLAAVSENFSQVPYRLPNKNTVYSRIRQNRGVICQSAIQAAKMEPLRSLNGNPFLRRHSFLEVHGEYHEFMIWATNECIALLRYNSHTFIDCTFKSTPSQFTQCLIIMVYDHATELYIPCVYALLTGKNECLYSSIFHEIIVLLEYNWMPKIITTDFEMALIKSIKYEFPESKLHGCYFHLKQAILRKLINFKISNTNTNIILQSIELLTLIPVSQIPAAIQFIKQKTESEDKLDKFWIYFEKTWLKRFDPTMWNSSNLGDGDMINRTNNALERYNRRLNDNFLNAHPRLVHFIEIIKSEFTYYMEHSNQIRKNSTIRFKEHPVTQNIVLLDFQNYINRLS